jgi:hypothetical protein
MKGSPSSDSDCWKATDALSKPWSRGADNQGLVLNLTWYTPSLLVMNRSLRETDSFWIASFTALPTCASLR